MYMSCKEYQASYSTYTAFPIATDIVESDAYMAWYEHGLTCADCIDFGLEQAVIAAGSAVEEFPCVHIAYRVSQSCPDHPNRFDCPDIVIVKHGDSYAIPIRDGGSSAIVITHCPWCGIALS